MTFKKISLTSKPRYETRILTELHFRLGKLTLTLWMLPKILTKMTLILRTLPRILARPTKILMKLTANFAYLEGIIVKMAVFFVKMLSCLMDLWVSLFCA